MQQAFGDGILLMVAKLRIGGMVGVEVDVGQRLTMVSAQADLTFRGPTP